MTYRHQVRDQRLNLVAHIESDREIEGTVLFLIGSDGRSMHLSVAVITLSNYSSFEVPQKFWIVQNEDIPRLFDAAGVIKL